MKIHLDVYAIFDDANVPVYTARTKGFDPTGKGDSPVLAIAALCDLLAEVENELGIDYEFTDSGVDALEHSLDCYKSDMRQLENDARSYVARYERAELRLAEIEAEYAVHRKYANDEITKRGRRISELEAVEQLTNARQTRLESELDAALKVAAKVESEYLRYAQEMNGKLTSFGQDLGEVLQIVKSRAVDR